MLRASIAPLVDLVFPPRCPLCGAAIGGQTPAINNAEQAVELMEMIDGIYASSELGREVPLA